MKKIENIHDKLFKEVMKNPENAVSLLKTILPEKILKWTDFTTINIEPTNYVSKEYQEYFSDLVVSVNLKNKKEKSIPLNIYFILDHKTDGKSEIFIQFLTYMVQEWREDIKAKRPLRIILPVVFYHGKKKWKVPPSFIDLFDVEKEIKESMLDFQYIFFNTQEWDFRDEKNEELRNNVFAFTSMVLMKCAFTNDLQAIDEIIRFWKEKGFLENIEKVIFFLLYVSQTQEINAAQLKKMLVDKSIQGGEIMQTLAQTWLKEGRQEGMQEGQMKSNLEIAKKMLMSGESIEKIKLYTGLSEKQIRSLMQ